MTSAPSSSSSSVSRPSGSSGVSGPSSNPGSHGSEGRSSSGVASSGGMTGRGDSSSPKRSGPSCPKTSGSTASFSMPGSGTLSSTVKTLVDGCDTFSSVRPAPRGTSSAKENQQEADHRHNGEGGPRDLNRRAHRVAEPLSFTAARGGHERGNKEGHNV